MTDIVTSKTLYSLAVESVLFFVFVEILIVSVVDQILSQFCILFFLLREVRHGDELIVFYQ